MKVKYMLYNNQEITTPKYVITLARENRMQLTESEKILWFYLKNRKLNGFRFRCQHPVYRYILDFYCHEVQLAIEVDGRIHNQQKEYDEYRDAFLKNIGITTIRFDAEDVVNNTSQVVNEILISILNKKL
jgi:very-short-patch-repair endonuclease